MAQLHLTGEPEIAVELRRNATARRLSLRVSQLDGRVTLTMPGSATMGQARWFARQKEPWIRRQLYRRIADIVPQIGGSVLFEGHKVPILAAPGRVVRYDSGHFLVPGDAEHLPVRIAAFMKGIARQRLSAACQSYADALGVAVKRITLRDTRSRWGSCTGAGNLMFSWRLILAPVDVLAYVAAHEVAHLVEMNHSPAYWSVLAGISPDYQTPRRWLRQNGALLHSYRFGRLTPAAVRDHIHTC